MTRHVLRGVVILGVLGSLAAAPPRPAAREKLVLGKLHHKAFEQSSGKAKFDYLLYLPADYEREQKNLPIVLFLHGMGDKLARLERGGLPRQVERKKESFILVAPQCPARFWNPRDLGALLDDVTGRYRVDLDRVYVTGLSMGGFGTWSLASAYPDRFAAIIPICGGGNPGSARKIKDVPVWVFHGGKDTTVKPERSEVMVKALKDAGSTKVKYTVYPEAGHDSWTATYRDAKVWEWLLSQKRPGKQ